MPDLVTRCPKCGTRFNAAADQLDAAGGLVRCGVCLTVFDGREHLDAPASPVSNPESDPPPEEPQTPAVNEVALPPALSFEETRTEHESKPCADLEDCVRYDDNSAPPPPLPPEPEAEAASPEPGDNGAPATVTPTDPEIPPAIDDSSEAPLYLPAGQGPRVDTTDENDDPECKAPSTTDDINAVPAADTDRPQTRSPAWPRPPSLGAAHQFTLGQAPTVDQPHVGACPAGEAENGSALEVPTIATDTELLRPPVLTAEIFAPGEQPPAPRSKTLLWSTLSLLALVTLAGQYTWFHADELATRFEQWRPQLARFCELTHCELPIRSDLSRLQVNGLVVRTHPQQADALLVEARLVNRAGFAQPLPPLTLQFEDLQGQPVASRTFSPRQYVPDIAGAEPAMIASRQQVPVRLEISDPGPAAVSYLLSPARQ